MSSASVLALRSCQMCDCFAERIVGGSGSASAVPRRQEASQKRADRGGQALEAGGTEKAAGSLGRRPGTGQGLDAASRVKGSGTRTGFRHSQTVGGEKAQRLQGGS
ncbi:hypothetical protein EYF80_006522 [Liparis tanakae]|uniref:Uncharacterized protein n=1 Tax=Liparis tanakae TaxID=230148 RepID=A0A4Z2IYX3_9TELE|nr:hypothetical protein EYF80_006522 [Liparis tanakae]